MGFDDMWKRDWSSQKERPMAQDMDNEVSYYYDRHPIEEDLMGESFLHRTLTEYLEQVLTWLFYGQMCAIYANLNFYYRFNRREYPVAPDVAVLKGVPTQVVSSWCVGQSGPAPQVVFEIASPETWHNDLYLKPLSYAHMGVQEYFAYDPYSLPLSKDTSEKFFDSGIVRHLFGWRLDADTRRMHLLSAGPAGQLWSEHLESTLVPEPNWLRLYDRFGQVRLTMAEAAAWRAEQEAEARQAETMRADTEARRAEALAAKLRSLGFDSDQI